MFRKLTQVEVVVLSVSNGDQEDNGVDDGYMITASVQGICSEIHGGGEAEEAL